MTVSETVVWRALWIETAERLEGAADEARWICQEASGFEGRDWLEALDRPASQRSVARLDAMVERRRSGEPLQYVLGSWSFRGIDLFVDRRVLIPRPETELVAEVALALARRRRPVVAVDLGTGSGAIALALAAELPVTGVEIWGTDRSASALDVARANLASIGRRAANVRLATGDWYDALPPSLAGGIDVVVSNPPYVAANDALGPEVADWEPLDALLAGADGLDALRVVVGGAPYWLAPGGHLVTEIGAGQGAAVSGLARQAGLIDVEVRVDLNGHDRIAVARRPAS